MRKLSEVPEGMFRPAQFDDFVYDVGYLFAMRHVVIIRVRQFGKKRVFDAELLKDGPRPVVKVKLDNRVPFLSHSRPDESNVLCCVPEPLSLVAQAHRISKGLVVPARGL